MNEFNILLIDDEDEQKDLFDVAVKHYNLNKFIDSLCEKYQIVDNKLISSLRLMENDEEILKKIKDKGFLIDENYVEGIFSVKYEFAKTPEEAMTMLYEKDFDSLIVDLRLESKDIGKEDENLSGNVLLRNIIKKEIIPIVVRSGFYEKTDEELSDNIIGIYSKEDKTFQEIIDELIETYNSCGFAIFGSNGKIKEYTRHFFWTFLKKCFKNNKDELIDLDISIKEKVILRYMCSWLNNKLSYDKKYLSVEPMEMYMFPSPIDTICTCDIYYDDIEETNYIVLTPACDLANNKTDTILFAKIIEHDNVTAFNDCLNAYCKSSSKDKKDKHYDDLGRLFRNGHPISMRYHFLPKVSFFEGGFVDFRSLICIGYDNKEKKLKNEKMIKKGTITDAFKKDIIERFSSYYQRQGQPEFDTKSLIKKHI